MAITWKWGGTAIAGSRSSGAVWAVQDIEVGPLVFAPRVQVLGLQHGERETYAPLPEAARSWMLTLLIDASAVTGSGPTAESRAMDAWAEAMTFFDPYNGAAKLECTRPNSDTTSIVRHLYASVLELPDYRDKTADASGLDESAAYPNGGPYLVFKVGGDTRFPWWCRSSLLATDTSPAAAEVDVGGGTDTVTINNPGDRWGGCRLVVKAASVSGTVNGFTVTNTTNGDVLKITKSTAMAAGEYVDWLASDPREVDKTTAWKFGTGDPKLRLDQGNNTLSVVRTGAGTGSLTLQVSWPSFHYAR